MPSSDRLTVVGAREHNLRGVSVDLPRGRLICFTGVSGSGKSSLAFDTLFAEGQRRYIESLSSYARQFLGQLPKPDVDLISGLPPSISIQQKSSGWNPRSTVGTITQVHDYARVLFARVGVQHCPHCGKPISAQTREQMISRVLSLPAGTRILLLAPKVRQQKGEFRDLFDELLRAGFVRARVDGEVIELSSPPALDRYRRHEIEAVVDRLEVRASLRPRLAESLDAALEAGDGTAIVSLLDDARPPAVDIDLASPPPERSRRGRKAAQPIAALPASRDILLSSAFACVDCGLSFEPPAPQMFSFNSPQGMCTHCDGLGARFDFDESLLIPDTSLPFLAPCVVALRNPPGRWPRHIYQGVADHFGFDLEKPWRELPAAARRVLLYGAGDAHITYTWRSRSGAWKHGGAFPGVIADLQAKYKKSTSALVRSFYERFMRQAPCSACKGGRLNPQALAVKLTAAPNGGPPRALNIDEACRLSIEDAVAFFASLSLDGVRKLIAEEPLKEIHARLRFLLDVGLGYLTLERRAPTLSGGESQRIRLASQIGSGLVGVLYVLDEPSIGLHPRDNQRLLASLRRLRDMGNTVIVVEHDEETMRAADFLVDFGPGPGIRGGEIVASGSLDDLAGAARSLTGAYLSGRRRIETPLSRRPINPPPPDPPRGRGSSRAAKRSSREA